MGRRTLMSNAEIIKNCMMFSGITEPVDTLPGWNSEGFRIKKGSKAAFNTKIWKPCKAKDPKTGESKEKLLLVNASFFTASQVEKAEN
jgi:hypothetical protein